jgi:hypothetical protein
MKKKETVKQRKLKSGHEPHRGHNAKTNWSQGALYEEERK